MKRTLAALAGGPALLVLLVGCGSDESQSVADRVSEACVDAIEEHGERFLRGAPEGIGVMESLKWDYDSVAISSLDISNLEAREPDKSDKRATKAWTVTGSVTAHRTKVQGSSQWDDDGLPSEVADMHDDFLCIVGYRERDDQIVVFEYKFLELREGKQVGGSVGEVFVTTESVPQPTS